MTARIRSTFHHCQSESRPAFVAYITAGFPDVTTTANLLLELQSSGTDIIELGVPFTDPLADGVTIQHSTQAALRNGVNLDTCLSLVQDARKAGLIVPVLLMGYYNPLLQFGEEKIMKEAKKVGVDGFIVVDLPPDEAIQFRTLAQSYQLSYVPLITPTTSLNRMERLVSLADSFIYVVSRNGVTGERTSVSTILPPLIQRIRQFNSTVPLAVGFGVANRDHFLQVGKLADGVVIGSKIITEIQLACESGRDPVQAVRLFVMGVTGNPHENSKVISSPTNNAEITNNFDTNIKGEIKKQLNLIPFILNPRFGEFGGQYVPEALVDCLTELETAFVSAKNDSNFWDEFRQEYAYCGRPSPLHYASRLTESVSGARIWLKREDLNHTGSHKINNALGQILLAKRLGKKRIIAETGAGQHGVATATVCAKFGFECVIYMGATDCNRQRLNVFRIQLLGGKVIPVETGTKTLKDAINEAMRDWVTNVETTHYLVGSAIGPHPFPTLVREFQSVIGRETITQFREVQSTCKEINECKLYPDAVVACVGGGSNAIGMFGPFVDDPQATSVRLIGVEAAGSGLHAAHSATLSCGTPGVLHGTRTYLLQDTQGNIMDTHSVSAGLDYPGVGPEHAHLKQCGRAEYIAVTDDQCLKAFATLARLEGIIPALETAHAVHAVMNVAQELGPNKDVILCLSGRGDKDVSQVMTLMNDGVNEPDR